MSIVKQVINPITINTNRSIRGRSISGEVGVGVRVVVWSECDGFLGGEARFIGGGGGFSGMTLFPAPIRRHRGSFIGGCPGHCESLRFEVLRVILCLGSYATPGGDDLGPFSHEILSPGR